MGKKKLVSPPSSHFANNLAGVESPELPPSLPPSPPPPLAQEPTRASVPAPYNRSHESRILLHERPTHFFFYAGGGGASSSSTSGSSPAREGADASLCCSSAHMVGSNPWAERACSARAAKLPRGVGWAADVPLLLCSRFSFSLARSFCLGSSFSSSLGSMRFFNLFDSPLCTHLTPTLMRVRALLFFQGWSFHRTEHMP